MRIFPDSNSNPKTCVALHVWQPGPTSFREQFLTYYGAIRARCEGQPPGLTLVAVGPGGLATARLEPRPAEISAIIAGRHDHAGLRLSGDATVSLRHLAVVLPAPGMGDDPRFRVLDLGTPTALGDEEGRRLESLEAEGPVLLECGAHLLFLLPTGDGVAWADDPAAGWEHIPPRLYFAEQDARQRRGDAAEQEPPTPSPVPSPHGYQREVTRVQTLAGPRRAEEVEWDGDPGLGQLELRGDGGSRRLTVSPEAARRGLLLGRYDRCDRRGRRLLDDHRISRVHLLVLQVGDALWAIDTASTNGLTDDHGGDVPLARLEPDRPLQLAGRVELRWHPRRGA